MKVDCCVDLSQQMVRRNHLFQTYKFNLAAIFSIFRKHVHHPYSFYHIFASFTRKRPPIDDFFKLRGYKSLSACRKVQFWLLCQGGLLHFQRKNSSTEKENPLKELLCVSSERDFFFHFQAASFFKFAAANSASPVGNLSQASVRRIAHTVLFFASAKTPLDLLLS